MRYIYVSGPYSNGDQALNVRRAIEAADALLNAGFFPYCPHLSHFHHILCPHDYETWMRLDLAWLERCDAVVRLSGHSPGADREVARAHELGIPVYFGVEDFLRSVRDPFVVLNGYQEEDSLDFPSHWVIEED